MTDTDRQPAYRWVILGAAAVMLALSMGQLVNGLTAFFYPLEQEFGWRRGDIALINTAGVAGLAIGGILIGRLSDRIGIRPILLAGASVLGLCVLAASRAESLWQLYALFFVAGMFGGAAFFAPVVAMVGNWFVVGSGMALGIASAGQAVGQGAIPWVTALLIEDFGWRGAFATLGVVTLAILIPLALLTREPPRPAAGSPGAAGGGQAVPLSYWTVVVVLGAAVVGCCTLMSVPLMHLVPLMQGRGIEASDAGGVMFAMLTAGIFGRLFFGKLADIAGAVPAYMTASAWQTLMVFGFTFFETLDAFYLYALFYGFGYAGVMTGVLTTTRALTTPDRRASAMGVVGAAAWVGHGIGGFMGGALFDVTGDYAAPFAVAAAAGVANLTIMAGLWFGIRRRSAPVAA